MAYNYEYPYVDSQDYNDDWLLHAMQEYKAEWAKILEEITNKWGEYQEQIDHFKDQVNQDITSFENSLTQQWTQYQQETNHSLELFKNALTQQWSDVEQEWQDYKKTLTADWTAYQQTQAQLWQEFKTGIEATQDAFQTEVLADISTLESAWATYKTTVNNALSAQDTKIAEYKAYMDNYFSTLDLTTEISNKIDGMVSDGTMDTIINTEVFNGLNAKIGGLYKANGIPIMIGEQISSGGSARRLLQNQFANVFLLDDGVNFFHSVSTSCSFFTDLLAPSGEVDGITQLKNCEAQMSAQQILNVSDIYMISYGNYSSLSATEILSNINKLYAYIKSHFLNATPHIITCGRVNDWVNSPISTLYRNLHDSARYGTYHDLTSICYNTFISNRAGQYTASGLNSLSLNMVLQSHGAPIIYRKPVDIPYISTNQGSIRVSVEANGVRWTNVLSNGIAGMTTNLFNTQNGYAVAHISKQANNVHYNPKLTIPVIAQFFAPTDTSPRLGEACFLYPYETESEMYVIIKPINYDVNIAQYNQCSFLVNSLIPWEYL